MVSSVVGFVVVLGVLVFVHELGHFLMAKYFGVGVEKFSLGFGPKLLGKKYGETEYLLSAIPLGGYVKMVGEDPKEPLAPEDQKRSFNFQSLGRRFWIVFAGPLFNILFAVLVFLGMFMIGYPTDDSTIGWVERNSPAWQAGLQAGDRVISVNGQDVRIWEDVAQAIQKSKDQPLSLEILRDDLSLDVTVRPKVIEGKNIFGEHEDRVFIGVQHHTLGAVVGVSMLTSPAGRAGIRTGDLVLSVNGLDVDSFPALERSVLGSLGPEVLFQVRRKEGDLFFTVTLSGSEIKSLEASGSDILEKVGLVPAELFVRQVLADSPADKAGIQVDDRILTIEGEPIFSFAQLQDRIGEKPGVPVGLQLIRAGTIVSVEVTPEERIEKDVLGNEVSVGKIGVVSAYHPKPGPTLLIRYNPLTALIKSFAMTWDFTVLIVVSLFKLIQQVIPAETIGGPILIAQLAGQQIQYGILELFKFMALISINLGILNLLPIPILDGGHILFFGIEGVLGRPLSMRKREIAQQIGLFLLLSLILFVTYNDIMRMFG